MGTLLLMKKPSRHSRAVANQKKGALYTATDATIGFLDCHLFLSLCVTNRCDYEDDEIDLIALLPDVLKLDDYNLDDDEIKNTSHAQTPSTILPWSHARRQDEEGAST